MSGPPLWFEQALLPQGWCDRVRISGENGVINAIAPGVEPQAGDERHGVALPGLPNVHSHAFQRGMAGLAERKGPARDSFWTWREVMYRFLDRLGPEEVEAIAALAYAEMLESGFTRVGEFHYLHHAPGGAAYANPAELAERIAASAAATGIGLTLLPVFYAHGGFGGAEPTSGQSRFLSRTPDDYARLHEASARTLAGLDDAVIGVAPHSLRAITPDQLAAILPLAGDGPLHIHAAEQAKEVEDCLAWSGARPVEWLLDNAPLSSRWSVIHATHLTAGETERLARSGAVVGLCPLTEANLGDGIFPALAFFESGGRFGAGSDSNILIDAARELELLEYTQRLGHRGRNLLAGREGTSTGGWLFRQALMGGAQGLGVTAGLMVGASAEIVSLDLNHPSLIERRHDALIDGWIFSAGRAAIDCVWRRGDKVVRGGRHRDAEPIRARYRATMRRLLA
jgi:formimidoylglutamate deiminase